MPDPIPVSVANLLPRPREPQACRRNPKASAATIRAMATTQGTRLVALASDIVQHGLDPTAPHRRT